MKVYRNWPNVIPGELYLPGDVYVIVDIPGSTQKVHLGGVQVFRGHTVRLNEYWIKTMPLATPCVDDRFIRTGIDKGGVSEEANEVGGREVLRAMMAYTEEIKKLRPVTKLILDFHRISGARGTQELHRKLTYDITGRMPRKIDSVIIEDGGH